MSFLNNEKDYEWEALTPDQKREHLYRTQKETLDSFLERGAITPEQYEKSLGDLSTKMGFPR